MRDEAEGAWYSCKQGYLLEAVVLLVWRNMHPTACRLEPNQSRWYMVLLQTGLLAGSGGVACVEEHALEIWLLVKPKVHDTLLPTGLLAGSGGFAGVEEHALDSSLLVTGISSLLGTGGNLEGIVLSRVSSSVANVGLARAEESARQLVAGNWDQLAARNWGKSGGHRTLSGVIICCKRWSRSCRGKCPTARCW
jgi:hypothetical protein